MELLFDSLLDGLLDSAKLIPFLFVTYLLMEWIEAKTEEKQKQYVESAGAYGPLAGGILGAVPQCGFSCVASNLYSGGVITVGVLLAVFMSTSDEMLPILISHTVHVSVIVRILVTKATIAVVTGYLVDLANKYVRKRWLKKRRESLRQDVEEQTGMQEKTSSGVDTDQSHGVEHGAHTHRHVHAQEGEKHIHELCEQDHCNCEDGIWLSALKHTVKITIFIFAVSVVLNIIIEWAGEDAIGGFLSNMPFLGEAVAALIGLIPNCAASVIITELYLDDMMSAGAMMAGLLVSAGVGLLVLVRMNRHRWRENLRVIGTLYVTSVFWGLLIDLCGITF